MTKNLNERIRRGLPDRIRQDNPVVTKEYIQIMTEKVLAINEALKEEVLAWIEGYPFHGYRVRDKYTVAIALQTRQDRKDVLGAILALDAYERDERKEGLLWRTKR